jgi:DNA-binding transcriptional MerR regulator
MLKAGEIRKRGGYQSQTMRYVLAQRIIPGIGDAGQGNHRKYTPEQTVLLAVACELREAGIFGEVVKLIVEAIADEGSWHLPGCFTFSRGNTSVAVDTEAIRKKLRI